MAGVTFTGDVEVWQRGDGSWNWVLIERPNVHKPAVMLMDSTPHPDPHTALREADRVIAGWEGRETFWLQ